MVAENSTGVTPAPQGKGLDSRREKTKDDVSKTVVRPWGGGPGESLHAMLRRLSLIS